MAGRGDEPFLHRGLDEQQILLRLSEVGGFQRIKDAVASLVAGGLKVAGLQRQIKLASGEAPPAKWLSRLLNAKRIPAAEAMLPLARTIAGMYPDPESGALKIPAAASDITREIKRAVATSLEEVQAVWARFSGRWACVSLADNALYQICRLRILDRPNRVDHQKYPLPRFALDLGTIGRGSKAPPLLIAGYVQFRDGHLYLIGESKWLPRGHLGFMTFYVGRKKSHDLIRGHALLPSVDRSPIVPRAVTLFRVASDRFPLGPRSQEECEASIPGFKEFSNVLTGS